MHVMMFARINAIWWPTAALYNTLEILFSLVLFTCSYSPIDSLENEVPLRGFEWSNR